MPLEGNGRYLARQADITAPAFRDQHEPPASFPALPSFEHWEVIRTFPG
jgi:hypothetical protein